MTLPKGGNPMLDFMEDLATLLGQTCVLIKVFNLSFFVEGSELENFYVIHNFLLCIACTNTQSTI